MDKFKSRKFWVSIVTALLVIANKGLDLGLPEESIMTIAGLAITYILGQSVVDSAGKKKP